MNNVFIFLLLDQKFLEIAQLSYSTALSVTPQINMFLFIYSLLEEYKEYKQRSESINNPTESPEKLPEILSSLKGSFFFNGDNVISHQYSMVMIKPSRVKIALEV